MKYAVFFIRKRFIILHNDTVDDKINPLAIAQSEINLKDFNNQD
jgi:hypothetical protein